jgi:hypothetical protein
MASMAGLLRRAGRPAFQQFLHALGGPHAIARRLEGGHQPVAEGLDQLAATFQHGLADLTHGLRDHGAGLGIAEGFVQPGAAAQVGKKDGALADRGHDRSLGREKGRTGRPCCDYRLSR